jgi:tetratricopeptide (TPR) repeat protein/energy-coupling factor transporter ATP-binding protein EcfA2
MPVAKTSLSKGLATVGVGAQLCAPVLDLASGGALTGAAVLTSVLGAAAGFSQDVCSKMAADRVEGWLRTSGGEEMLTNHHLNAALGDAIAEIIKAQANACEAPKKRKALTALAEQVPRTWQALGAPPLGEGDVADMFARRAGEPDAPLLTEEAWREVTEQLAHLALDPRTRTNITTRDREALAVRLHTELPFALREVLKRDQENGGRAYAGLVLLLLGETLAAVRASSPGGGDEELAEHVTEAIGEIREPLIAELDAISDEGAAQHAEAIGRLDRLLGVVREEHVQTRRVVREEVGRAREDIQEDIERFASQLVEREQVAPTRTSRLPARPDRFIGREEAIKEVLGALAEHSLVVVSGTGGMGKSTLVRALARCVDRARRDDDVSAEEARAEGEVDCPDDADFAVPWATDGIDYVDLSGQASAPALIGQIAERLGLDPIPESAGGLLKRLEPRGARLYVLDDVQQALVADEAATQEFIRALSAYDGGVRVLLTCRREAPAGRDIELGPLSRGAARTLFREVAEAPRNAGGSGHVWTPADSEALEGFLPELSGHPLSIELAAGQMAVWSSVAALREKWTERRTALLRKLGGSGHRLESVTVSLDLSYAALDSHDDPETARALFALMADLPGGATPELVEALFGFEGVHAMEALRRRRLVYRDGRRYQALVPVRHFAAEKTVPEAEAKRPEVDDFLLALAQEAYERWIEGDEAVAVVRLMQAERPNVEASLQRAVSRGDDPHVAALVSAAARTFERQFGKSSSKKWLEKGRAAAKRIEDSAAWARSTYHLGEVARMQDDYDRATQLLQEAHEVHHEIGDRFGEANCTQGLGCVGLVQDDPDRAIQLLQEARAIYCEIGNRLGEAHCTKCLGEVARLQNNYDQAMERYRQARAICREIGYRRGEASCTKGLGDVALAQGDSDRAAELFQEARAVYREIGDRLGEAHCTKGLGEVARMQGDHDRATELFQEARAVYREIGDRLGEAHCTQGLGSVALAQGDHDRAAELHCQARESFREIGDRLGEAHCTQGLGSVALAQGDHDQAAELFQEARAVYREIGVRFSEANCTQGLGSVALAQDDYDKATQLFQEAREVYREIGVRVGEAHCTKGLGDVALLQGDSARAAELFQDACAVYREIGDRYSLAAVHYKLGLALVGSRQPEKACHALREAERLFEEIKHTRGAQRARDAMEQLLGGCS